MIRRLFTRARVLAPLLCLAIAAAWLRSYYFVDGWGLRPSLHIESERGTVFLEWIELAPPDEAWERWKPGRYSIRVDPEDDWRELATSAVDRRMCGCGVFAGSRPVRRYDPEADLNGLEDFESVRLLYLPFWVIEAGAAAFTLVSFRGVYRSMIRRRAGKCPSCGYDLRASKGRCPECGTPIIPRRERTNGTVMIAGNPPKQEKSISGRSVS